MNRTLVRTRPVAVVTGASSGLGVDLADCLARRRYDLVLVARREDRLLEVSERLATEHGVVTQILPVDLAAADGPDRVLHGLEQLNLEPSVLVNNAGLGQWGPYLGLDGERERSQLMVNVVALTRLSRLLLPGMVARGEGRILNVASTAAFFPGPLMTVYYATKAYVLSYSVGLAEELRGSGVSVTCLCLGPIETEFSQLADQNRSKLFQNSSVMDTKVVAEEGVEATLRGELIRTPGVMNKFNALGSRLLPRGFLARVVKSIQGPKS